jgi:pilus assembly protein FimV
VGEPLGTAALTTKLELAMACREIGDNDGARELLAEVANARDAELAGRAKSLLQQLA